MGSSSAWKDGFDLTRAPSPPTKKEPEKAQSSYLLLLAQKIEVEKKIPRLKPA